MDQKNLEQIREALRAGEKIDTPSMEELIAKMDLQEAELRSKCGYTEVFEVRYQGKYYDHYDDNDTSVGTFSTLQAAERAVEALSNATPEELSGTEFADFAGKATVGILSHRHFADEYQFLSFLKETN